MASGELLASLKAKELALRVRWLYGMPAIVEKDLAITVGNVTYDPSDIQVRRELPNGPWPWGIAAGLALNAMAHDEVAIAEGEEPERVRMFAHFLADGAVSHRMKLVEE